MKNLSFTLTLLKFLVSEEGCPRFDFLPGSWDIPSWVSLLSANSASLRDPYVRVRDLQVEVKPPCVPPNSPQSDR